MKLTLTEDDLLRTDERSSDSAKASTGSQNRPREVLLSHHSADQGSNLLRLFQADESLREVRPTDLIATISDPAIRALASLGGIRSYPKQAVIISEGDSGDKVFIILTGRVRVYSADEHGRQVVLDVLGSGELVGEMGLDGSPRSASVMTIEATTAAVLETQVLRERLAADGDLAMLLVTGLLGRLRRTTQIVKTFALGDVYERLVVVLKELFAASQTSCVLDGLTQQDLADRIGSSRDMVNRIVRELEKGGYLQVARRRITLLKPLPPRW